MINAYFKYLLLTCSLLFTQFATSQAPYYFEDFSGGMPANWITIDGDTNTINLVFTSQSGYNMSNAWIVEKSLWDTSKFEAISCSWYQPPGTSDDWMITDSIWVDSPATIQWVSRSLGNFLDDYEVRISPVASGRDTTSFLSFDPLVSVVEEVNDLDMRHSVSMLQKGFANEWVYVAFRNHTVGGGVGLAIDSIEMSMTDSIDLTIIDLIVPESNCFLDSAETITIKIVSLGTQMIRNPNAILILNNDTVDNITIQDSLSFYDTLVFQFPTPVNLSTDSMASRDSIFEIRAVVNAVGDKSPFNNYLEDYVWNYGCFPYFSTFNINTCPKFSLPFTYYYWKGLPITYTFLWNTGDTTNNIDHLEFFEDTTLVLTVSTSLGQSYTDSFEISIDCEPDTVWPGDADRSKRVLYWDIFPLGIAWDSTGPPRDSISINWKGYYAADWNFDIDVNLNAKSADCNGNGIVDSADIDAIWQNYGNSYSKGGAAKFNGRAGELPLIIDMPDTASVGDTIKVNIKLGTPTIAGVDVYAVGFSLNYDATELKAGSFKANYDTSWIGALGNDMIAISKELSSTSAVDVGITRTNRVAVGGSGDIMSFDVIVIDNISGKDQYKYGMAKLFFTEVILLDQHWNEIDVEAFDDSTVLVQKITSLRPELNSLSLRVFPNPAKNEVTINSNETIESVKMYSVSGKEILSKSLFGSSITLDLDDYNIATGLYLLSVTTTSGKVKTKKLSVSH